MRRWACTAWAGFLSGSTLSRRRACTTRTGCSSGLNRVFVPVKLPGVYDLDKVFVRANLVGAPGVHDPDLISVRLDPVEVPGVVDRQGRAGRVA